MHLGSEADLPTAPNDHPNNLHNPTHRGTILGTSAVVSKVLLTNSHAIDWALLPRALMGLLALLCGNGYIVGINQIYDVDIDAVNKPFLPVAAGGLLGCLKQGRGGRELGWQQQWQAACCCRGSVLVPGTVAVPIIALH